MGCFKRIASKRILSRVKQITSPGWMHETSTGTWCSGKTQRERVEREVGGGIGMGNTCKPMAVSFQCMTKSTIIQKIKIKVKLGCLLSPHLTSPIITLKVMIWIHRFNWLEYINS